MSNFKGFGTSSRQRQTPKRTKRKLRRTFSVDFENYVAKHLGEDWSEGLSFNTFDAPNSLHLVIEVPQESHSVFTHEYQHKIQTLAKKFGADHLEIHLVNLSKTRLRQRAKIRFRSSYS